MAGVPENFLDLPQQKPAFAELATLIADGSPQVAPDRRPRESGGPGLTKREPRISVTCSQVPAFAGTTKQVSASSAWRG